MNNLIIFIFPIIIGLFTLSVAIYEAYNIYKFYKAFMDRLDLIDKLNKQGYHITIL